MEKDEEITEAEYHRRRCERVGIEYIPKSYNRLNAVSHHDKAKKRKEDEAGKMRTQSTDG